MIVLATAMSRLDEVRGSLAARLAREGATIRDRQIDVDIAHGDAVVVRRRQVGLEPTRTRLDGRYSIETRIATDDRRRVDAAVDRFITRQEALMRRERAIADREDGDVVPAWSVLAHPLLAAAILAVEPDLANGVAIRRTGGSDDGSGYATAGDHGMTVATRRLVRRDGIGNMASIRDLGLSGGVLHGVVSLERGATPRERGLNVAGRIEATTARTTLTLSRATLPHALKAAARGRSLESILKLPMIDASRCVVTKVASNGGDLVIGVRGGLVALAPPPADADASWIDDLARTAS